MKDKLAIFDLDGTLFDTRKVNYGAYKKALNQYGSDIDYGYFSDRCNGNHYKVFLPEIMGSSQYIEQVHSLKKKYYKEFLKEAIENRHLFQIIEGIRGRYYIALVTTASRENCEEILTSYGRIQMFDLIITQEDVEKKKPDPEGFLLAMERCKVGREDTIIFEDSKAGLRAAERCGATVFAALGYA